MAGAMGSANQTNSTKLEEKKNSGQHKTQETTRGVEERLGPHREKQENGTKKNTVPKSHYWGSKIVP